MKQKIMHSPASKKKIDELLEYYKENELDTFMIDDAIDLLYEEKLGQWKPTKEPWSKESDFNFWK